MKIEDFIKKLQKDTGLVLMAIDETTELNGYVNTKQENGKVIVEVVLYPEDEPANYVEGIYKNIPFHHGHKNNYVKAKGNLKEVLTDAKAKLAML